MIRQTNRQADKETGRKTNRHADKQTGRERDACVHKG